jgi:hypothetical protein
MKRTFNFHHLLNKKIEKIKYQFNNQISKVKVLSLLEKETAQLCHFSLADKQKILKMIKASF